MLHEIEASEWLNTPEPLKLSALRGRVVVVTGLHSVFEHQHVMTPDALRALVHEYRLPFPIAIDRPNEEVLFKGTAP